jgi:hypothetical protein
VTSHITWLENRTPESPAALVERIRNVFAEHPEYAQLHRVDAFVDAGEVLLRRVLVTDTEARASALDLLAADACVTYAFEAAADEPSKRGARAAAATIKIARVADEASGGNATDAAGIA